jgi:hypothetical protein
MYFLFPGRHHLLTNFQFNYLFRLIQSDLSTTTVMENLYFHWKIRLIRQYYFVINCKFQKFHACLNLIS